MTQVEYFSEATTLVPHLEFTGDKLFEIALMYSSGRSITIDRVQAHKFFNLAAFKGIEVAKDYRKDLAAEMEKDEIAIAQKEAREWLSGKFH